MTHTASRISVLQTAIRDQGLGAILVSNHAHLKYLFSFIGLSEAEREGWGLVTAGSGYLFTDARYGIGNEKGEVRGEKGFKIKLIDYKHKLSDQITEILKRERVEKIGFERDDLTYGEYTKLKDLINKIELVPIKDIVENLRMTKDADEIQHLTRACSETDAVLNQVARSMSVGMTERQIANGIERLARDKGLQLPFEPIVAVNAHSAIPHYNTQLWGSGKVKKSSIVLVDFGIKYKGYCADITRMFFVAPVADEMRNMYLSLLDIQQQTLAKAIDGTRAADVDSFSRNLLSKVLHLTLPHATGHGVGLQIHEKPSISPPSKDILRKGQVFTIEPGVYIPVKWGMRIEDTMMIDSSGLPTTLTKFSKSLRILL